MEGEFAWRYVGTTVRQTKVPSAALRRAPSSDAEQLYQLLYGELFEVLDEGRCPTSSVVVEPLAEAVARISSRGGGEPTAYRRI